MNFFIPKNAPDTEEAYAFLDYILEPEVAAKCFDFVGYYCTNKAADELVNPDLVENASDDGKKRAGDFFRKPGCDDKNSQAYEAHDQRVCIECMDAC